MLLRIAVLTALLAVLLAGLVNGADKGTSSGAGTSAQGQSDTSEEAPSSAKGGVAPAGFEQFLPTKPSKVPYKRLGDDSMAKSNSCCYELIGPAENCPSPRSIKMMVVTSQSKDTLQADAVSGIRAVSDTLKRPHLNWRCCTNDHTARGVAIDHKYLHCHSNPGAQFWRVSSPNLFIYNPRWDKEG